MARNSMRDQAMAAAVEKLAAPPGRVRPPGDVTTDPTPGTPRGNLLTLLSVPTLPPDSLLPDSLVTMLLTLDAESAKQKFRQQFCVPPAPFYCEAERVQWASTHPWCPPSVVPLVTVPTFTSDVERNAWIATHSTCPTPPPVLTDHVCTPGDPSCDTRGGNPGGSPIGWLFLGAVALTAWWVSSGKHPRKNPRLPRRSRFVEAYLETALWSSTDDNGQPLDKNYSVSDIDEKSLAQMVRDAESFESKHYDDISDDTARAGHDFWLTRNGHGAGFWDGDWPEAVGKRLTKAAEEFGPSDLQVDDGVISVYPNHSRSNPRRRR